jgi:hypothetical protein
MIKINLLPSEAGKRASAARSETSLRLPSGGALPLIALLFIVYAGLAYAAFWMYQKGEQSTAARREIESDKRKKANLVKRKQQEFEINNALAQETEEKFQVVQALSPQNRIFWSEKLNMIAKARLDLAVYVTKLVLNEQIDEMETPESVARREAWRKETKHPPGQEKEPKPIKRPIINQWLEIEAIAYGADSSQRLNQLNAFGAALRALDWKRENNNNARFMDGLTSEFGVKNQKTAKVGGVEVLRFGLICKAEPQLDRTPAAMAPQGQPAATPSTGGAAK